MMPNEYSKIFSHRGADYHYAMMLCPQARDYEFAAALSFIQDKPKGILLDVPSGGGYLRAYLDRAFPQYYYVSGEISSQFISSVAPSFQADYYSLPIQTESVDIVVTLAATHHFNYRDNFYKEIYRTLKPQGQFIVGDVIYGTAQAEFLNHFVDRHNSQGHKGNFFTLDTEVSRLMDAGFKQTEGHSVHYPWCFPNEALCLTYCKNLFGMDKASEQEVKRGLASFLNLGNNDAHSRIDWNLGFITGYKI